MDILDRVTASVSPAADLEAASETLVAEIILTAKKMCGHVGFSETVLVTEDGCEMPTDLEVERRLDVLA